jgi:hypothetical protein
VILAIVGLAGLVVILARALAGSAKKARIAESRADLAEAKLEAFAIEFEKREKERHALEADLATLRLGDPRARLDASLSILRDLSEAAVARDRVAPHPPPARDGN